MRIKKISENLVDDISSEKVEEIISIINKISADFYQGKENLKKINSDLERFTNKKGKNNDQIDDSVLNIEKGIEDMDDLLNLLDTIVENLDDYRENGRKYIY